MGIRMILLAMMLMFSTSVAAVTIKKSKSDEFCLALAAFTEAGAEGEHGMALVVHTVLNRASRRNKTVCQVTYAPNQYHGVLYWPEGSPRGFQSRGLVESKRSGTPSRSRKLRIW
ncbi:cell wall hydrolase [Xanthomonas phage JGB6]|nr:cell wall hydrolase [Xanthomonas phage JGB6]